MTRWISFALVLLVGLLGVVPAALAAEEEAETGLTRCTMTFDLKGWSLLYQTGNGQGVIKCDNGQSAKVKLKLTGGGITAGKTTVRNATGTFTEVSDISELYGAWAKAGATAAAGKAAAAGVITKGDISLALSGTGSGVELGISGGKLTITPVDAEKAEKKPSTAE